VSPVRPNGTLSARTLEVDGCTVLVRTILVPDQELGGLNDAAASVSGDIDPRPAVTYSQVRIP